MRIEIPTRRRRVFVSQLIAGEWLHRLQDLETVAGRCGPRIDADFDSIQRVGAGRSMRLPQLRLVDGIIRGE